MYRFSSIQFNIFWAFFFACTYYFTFSLSRRQLNFIIFLNKYDWIRQVCLTWSNDGYLLKLFILYVPKMDKFWNEYSSWIILPYEWIVMLIIVHQVLCPRNRWKTNHFADKSWLSNWLLSYLIFIIYLIL